MNTNTTTACPESAKPRLRAERLGTLSRTSESPRLANLKSRLLKEALKDGRGQTPAQLLRLAAIEAEAQAWLTSFPLLLFPALFEEKVRDVRTYLDRQQQLRI